MGFSAVELMPDALATLVPDIQPREFEQIRRLAQAAFGLELRTGKERLVSARLGKHVRSGGFRSFEDYFRHVQSDGTGESLLALIDALTTNHTAFLREPEHFRALVTRVLPGLRSGRVTLWSAAGSSGEEPYSMLFTILEAKPQMPDVRILATDISSRMLAIAEQGVYNADRLSALPPAWLQKYFDRHIGGEPGTWRVRAQYRAMIEFRRLNLMDALPCSFRFPVIFCRNVLIYFNRETQESVVNRLAGAIEPGGYLFTGHAESLTGIRHPLHYVQPAVYQRKA